MKRSVLVLLLAGCGAAATPPPEETPAPIRRILVECRFAEIGTAIGDAQLPASGQALVLREPPGRDPALSVRAPKVAAVGEEVTALIRVEGEPDRRYRVTIEPDRAGVRLLSPGVHTVPGDATLRLRFSREHAGIGSLVVTIRKLESGTGDRGSGTGERRNAR